MKENIDLKTKRGLVGVGWVITSPLLVVAIILILGTMNPMITMFMCTIKIINHSGEDVNITPIGTHIADKESRYVLDQYASNMPPIPVFKEGNFILRQNEEKVINYNCDDIRLSEILIRTNDGSYKQLSSQNNRINVIPPLSELPNASSVIINTTKGSEYKWVYWGIILGGCLSLFLYIWYRRLRSKDTYKTLSQIQNNNFDSNVNSNQTVLAKKIKKNKFFSIKGSATQLLGIILFIFTTSMGYYLGDNPGGSIGIIIGFVLMLIVFRIGSKLATEWYCDSCKTSIKGKNVSICPNCKAKLI